MTKRDFQLTPAFPFHRSVEETGSLEAAAKKLQQYAVTQAWEDDPEEAAYIAQTRNTDIEDGKFEDDVVMDDDDYDYEGQDQLQEVIHLQEIIPGLWVGDLVAAMDAPGLEERGIVSPSSSPSSCSLAWLPEFVFMRC